MIVLVVAANMGIVQPMHPAAQVAIVDRPERQMEVVGHQTVGQHAHGHFNAGMSDGLEERLVIAVFEKNLTAGIAAVDDVIANAANRGSSCAGHGN